MWTFHFALHTTFSIGFGNGLNVPKLTQTSDILQGTTWIVQSGTEQCLGGIPALNLKSRFNDCLYELRQITFYCLWEWSSHEIEYTLLCLIVCAWNFLQKLLASINNHEETCNMLCGKGRVRTQDLGHQSGALWPLRHTPSWNFLQLYLCLRSPGLEVYVVKLEGLKHGIHDTTFIYRAYVHQQNHKLKTLWVGFQHDLILVSWNKNFLVTASSFCFYFRESLYFHSAQFVPTW